MLFAHLVEVLDPEPHPAAMNMALDEALLQSAAMPALRVYQWQQPAVSFGYFGSYAAAHGTAAGRDLVRRWTGGGLVEHGADLTYTLIVPRDAAFFRQSALESYRLIHEELASWLGACGIPATVAPADAGKTFGSCFAGHVRHDLVTAAGKVAGAAQRRTRWGLLHQGSIQFPSSPSGTAAGDRSALSATGSLARVFAREVAQSEITPGVRELARQIARDKYATEAWLRKF